ncbi:hypothetical protein JV16_01593 [Anoxybacillus ayderensis]|uniref:YjcQ protein n=1 Tax=Anoxybacillus ayderensis TaxID=265546 RepID=A0A0D0HLR6_9BACL|nr:hypothetical protein [Anoxybacillus ayderensis]KIP21099.1 hypothetical protein JV16_01593 [Anoxybacillus ayderensis]
MVDIQLTKDADALICLLYKQYCAKLKDGVPKSQAKMFGSSEDIHQTIAPKWSFENVDETCRELHRAGLIECRYGDDIVWFVQLSDLGVIYMENRFKEGLKSVLEYLNKIRNVLPI